MSDTTVAEWNKELQLLLKLIQDRPSQDMTAERERVVVLNKLLAARDPVDA